MRVSMYTSKVDLELPLCRINRSRTAKVMNRLICIAKDGASANDITRGNSQTIRIPYSFMSYMEKVFLLDPMILT